MRWLLEHFGVEESLIGDIEEERHAGRSASWVLQQICAAILQSIWQDLRRYPWMLPQVALAYVVGYIGLVASNLTAWKLLLTPNPANFSSHFELSVRWSLTLSAFFFSSLISGWLVARLLQHQRTLFGLAWCYMLAYPFWAQVLVYPGPDPKQVFPWDTPHLRASLVTLGVLWGTLLVRPAARRRSTAAPSA